MTHYRTSLPSIAVADIRAALVVSLVALPLCLGIALASNAPLLSGLIAGIVGGVIVGILSGAQLSVSGPAAGLTVVVIALQASLGSFDRFLAAVLLAGVFQILLGLLRVGKISYFIPASVIRGMIAAIGLILVFKQIPHALGYSAVPIGEQEFIQLNSENTITSITHAFRELNSTALLVSLTAFLTMLAWERIPILKKRVSTIVPGALAGVLAGVGVYSMLQSDAAPDSLIPLVQLPAGSLRELVALLPSPDFSSLLDKDVILSGALLAAIASIETLLSVEAADKMDPHRRNSPPNRELIAQGVGNACCGLIGGLPLTAVVVRTSANIEAGAQTKFSAVLHGFYLLIALLALAPLINTIPLAALAALLILVGWKLSHPNYFIQSWREGIDQFLPFIVTVVGVITTDLLSGVLIGTGVGLFFVLKTNFHVAVSLTRYQDNYLVRLHKDISFLNRARLVEILESIPHGSKVLIDGTRARFIDHDIQETISDFIEYSSLKKIKVLSEGLTSLRHSLTTTTAEETDGTIQKIAA